MTAERAAQPQVAWWQRRGTVAVMAVLAALVTIDQETFPGWADKHGKTGSVADLIQDGDLVGAVQDAVDRANRSVSRAESIRKFKILAAEFSVEGGELTPTLKLKRNVVHDRFADDIENLYAK